MEPSIRTRLAFWFSLAAGVLLGIVLLTIYSLVRNATDDHLNDYLITKVHDVSNDFIVMGDSLVFVHMEDWEETPFVEHEVNPMFRQITDPSGAVIRRSENLRENTLPLHPDEPVPRYAAH